MSLGRVRLAQARWQFTASVEDTATNAGPVWMQCVEIYDQMSDGRDPRRKACTYSCQGHEPRPSKLLLCDVLLSSADPRPLLCEKIKRIDVISDFR